MAMSGSYYLVPQEFLSSQADMERCNVQQKNLFLNLFRAKGKDTRMTNCRFGPSIFWMFEIDFNNI